MEAKVIWLFAFVALYWCYCITMGVNSAMAAKPASDYFIAGRRRALWVFILAVTATSFSVWTSMGLPGRISRTHSRYVFA